MKDYRCGEFEFIVKQLKKIQQIYINKRLGVCSRLACFGVGWLLVGFSASLAWADVTADATWSDGVQANSTPMQKQYAGQPITLEFQEVPIRAVLEILSRFGQKNIIVDDGVKGNLTIRLINMPWDQALDTILQSKNLKLHQQDNVLWVSANTKPEQQPLQMRYFRLKYASAEEVQSLIVGEKTKRTNQTNSHNTSPKTDTVSNQVLQTVSESTRSKLLSERGTVAIDKRTNLLIVQDIEQNIEQIALLLERIDIPVEQVMIEARIVSVRQGFGREFGIDLGGRGRLGEVQFAGSSQSLWQQMSDKNGNISAGDAMVMLGANNPAGRIAFGLLNLPDRLLDLQLSAMQAENRGEVISTPKVLTADNQMARISSGVQIPYQEATSSGATSTSFKEASLVLEATPNITPEGNIALKLNIKNGVPVTHLGGVAIQEDAIETNVLVANGQTVVLGGIYRQNEQDTTKKIPMLGDLPYVGRLFRHDGKESEKSELLIFITPKLLK